MSAEDNLRENVVNADPRVSKAISNNFWTMEREDIKTLLAKLMNPETLLDEQIKLIDQYAQEKCLGEILKIEDTAETLQMKSSIPEDQYFAMLLGYIKSRGNILSLSTKEDKDD